LAKTALTASAISDYLELEQRWLDLARSYKFATAIELHRALQQAQAAEQ
jgi:hypothetical protein